VKNRQQASWSSGDYAVIGTTLGIIAELLCEAVDLRPDQRVLDVAAGNSNATLAAARRWADVTSTDYVAALLERGRAKPKTERLPMMFQEADTDADALEETRGTWRGRSPDRVTRSSDVLLVARQWLGAVCNATDLATQ
jgi:hypothetical protein